METFARRGLSNAMALLFWSLKRILSLTLTDDLIARSITLDLALDIHAAQKWSHFGNDTDVVTC